MTIYTKKLTVPDTGQMQWDGVDHGNVVDEAHGKFTDQ
jgi:hypothetical protein